MMETLAAKNVTGRNFWLKEKNCHAKILLREGCVSENSFGINNTAKCKNFKVPFLVKKGKNFNFFLFRIKYNILLACCENMKSLALFVPTVDFRMAIYGIFRQ